MKLVNIADIAGEVYEIGAGSAEVKHIVKENGFDARVMNISPGIEVPGKDHKHEEHEMLFVISGEATFYDGNRAVPLKNGDSVVVEPFEPHWKVAGKDGITIFELAWR